MDICQACGTKLHPIANYCGACGQPAYAAPAPSAPPQHAQPYTASPQSMQSHPQYQQPYEQPSHLASRGFAATFGIHPAIALLTLAIDSMLFGGEVMSLGAILPLSIAVSAALGYIAYRAQMKWYGDDKESAAIKAAILALLTAIPTALPAFLYVPAGVIGLFNRKKKLQASRPYLPYPPYR
jgi:hypothetical protein